MNRKLKIGDKVSLTEEANKSQVCPKGRTNNRSATIDALIESGGVRTDRDLRGCRYWNVADLQHA
jgi:hypothetical protein